MRHMKAALLGVSLSLFVGGAALAATDCCDEKGKPCCEEKDGKKMPCCDKHNADKKDADAPKAPKPAPDPHAEHQH